MDAITEVEAVLIGREQGQEVQGFSSGKVQCIENESKRNSL